MDTNQSNPLDQMLEEVSGQPASQPSSQAANPLDSMLEEVNQPAKTPAQAAPVAKNYPTKPSYQSKVQPDLSFGDMMGKAYDNFIPSAKKLGAETLSSLIHLQDTGQGLWHLGQAVASKIDGAAGREQDPKEKSQTEAPLDALMSQYKEKYGTLNGFKNYFANDPAGVLLDLSTVLSGGELAAGKVGSMIGKAGSLAGKAGEAASVLGAPGRAINVGAKAVESGLGSTAGAIQKASKVAGSIGENINPLNPLGILTPSKSVLPIGGANVLDRSGNFTDKANQLIQSSTNGLLSADHFSDPVAKAAMADAIKTKGFTPEAVREGILRSAAPEMQLPTASITGKAPPLAAQATTDNAIFANNQRIADAAKKIATPAGRSLGSDLEQALVNSHNNYKNLYSKVANTQGSYNYFSALGLRDKIQQNLAKSGITTDVNLLKRSTNMPNTNRAMDILDDVVLNGKTRTNVAGDITAQELNAVRKELSDLRSSASGSDIKGVSDIIDALDSHSAEMANEGHFIGPDGNPNTNIAKDLTNARDAYKNHMQTFGSPNGLNNNLVSASKQLESGIQRDYETGLFQGSGDADLHKAVESKLLKDLTSPTKGPYTYNMIKNALGNIGPEAMNDYLKSAAAPIKDGKLVSDPSTIQLISDPNSAVYKAFQDDPEALNELTRLHAANLVNNAKAIGKPESLLKGVVAPATSKAALQVAASHLMGFPGYVVGTALEKGAEALSTARKQKAALAGAPAQSGLVSKALKTAAAVTSPGAVNMARILNDTKPVAEQSDQKDQQEKFNVGNIRSGKDSFKTFDTPEEAVKATAELAQKYPSYFNNGQPMTLRQIANHWAPRGDKNNDPDQWAKNVGYLSGLDPDRPVDLSSKEILPKLVKAIHAQERGYKDLYNDEVYKRAVGAATGGRIERKSGGRVDNVQPLVDELMRKFKQAKKVTDKTTEPLLEQPDDAIVKALKVAQDAI